jgi:hypothetical protein
MTTNQTVANFQVPDGKESGEWYKEEKGLI